MVIQMRTLRGNRATQTNSVPSMQAPYFRIVQPHEDLADVHLEAIEHQCFVWTDDVKRTVISRNKPISAKRQYHKLHANFHDFGPECA